MPKLFFSSQNCEGATSGATGNKYMADRKGFINVDNPVDVKCLTAGGYVQAGGMPRLRKYFVCDGCGWEAAIKSCPKCHGDSFTRVER